VPTIAKRLALPGETPVKRKGTGPDREQVVELATCGVDVEHWIRTYVTIEDPQGAGVGLIPFALWPAQAKLLWTLVKERLVLILKARQLGISWLVCAYALHLCLFNDGRSVLLFSKGQFEANVLIRRILGMYYRLPDWMRLLLPQLTKENTEELEWSNGSSIMSLPATQNAGRSLTASLVVMDEAAFMMWASTLYTALKPTIDGGGQLIILSTANGVGNLFHQLWDRAEQGMGRFKTVFIPWWARPGRDPEWYAAVEAEETEPGKVKQEYPSSSAEAFVVSGHPRFATEWVDAQRMNVREPVPDDRIPYELRHIEGLHIFKLPEPGLDYVFGADVSEGVGEDWSTATVIDRESWEQMAEIHVQAEPDLFGNWLADLAIYYQAMTGIERNNHGHTTIASFKLVAPFLLVRGHDDRFGWLTNIKTKPVMIDRLAVALRDNLVTIRSAPALAEMRIYQKLNNGDTAAPSGYFDDRVMAWAIALAIATKPQTVGHAVAGGERTILKHFPGVR
jgi:hypothetical protein